MPYGKRALYRKRNGRTRKTTRSRTLQRRWTPSWKRTVGGFKAQGGTSIPRGLFPLTLMRKMRYVDIVDLNPTHRS
jgi:hypothetical protein